MIPTVEEPLTAAERDALCMILIGLWQGLDRHLSQRAAERWIEAHLTPGKRPNRLSIHYWRSCVESDTRRYVPRGVMAAALAANGIRVDGDRVFATTRRNQ
jgi:hypothetical protein